MTPKCPDCKRDQDECICSSPVSAPEALDWLETELSAISCRYHGDPSYDHDAYWMRGRVEKLLEEARKLFTAPTPPVSEDRKDAEIERLIQFATLTDGGFNERMQTISQRAERIKELESEVQSYELIVRAEDIRIKKQSAALKLAREALMHDGYPCGNGCKCRACEALAAIDALGE